MLLYPAMNDLLKNVPSRYLLVNVVANRARQLSRNGRIEGARADKPVTAAIHEVADGVITAESLKEEEEEA